MMYRIITEQHKKLPTILSRYFDGYTMLYGKGFWKGKPESCVVIEIDTMNVGYAVYDRIMAVIEDIKIECDQETVLLQQMMMTSKLI